MLKLKLWVRENWLYLLVAAVVVVFETAVRAGWWLPEHGAPVWYLRSR